MYSPLYKHLGASNTRTSSPAGRRAFFARTRINPCVILHHHPGREHAIILLVGVIPPGSKHRQLARQVGDFACPSRFLVDSWMASSPLPFSAGAVVWFGSLEFLATGNGNELTLLSTESPSGGRVTSPRAGGVARRPHHHASPPRERRRRHHRRQAQAVPAAYTHFPATDAESPRRNLPGARPETSRARAHSPSEFAFEIGRAHV